jgi:hypothetical protein
MLHAPALAHAEQPLLAPDGLHGGRYVGLAHPPTEMLRLASSLGYAYTESVLGDDDQHQRVAGELYAAWLKWPALQLSLGAELRYDAHSTASSGTDSGWLGATRLTTRHALRVHPKASLAAQSSVLFPGAANARLGLRAASCELAALASYALARETQFGMSIGYRIDRTKNAVSNPALLSPSDALSASLAAHDAYLLGALVAFPLQSLRALVEFSWDIPAAGALRPIETPMRVRAALQKTVSKRFVPGVELGLDASARPPFEALVRIEPRVWARVGVSVLLDPSSPSPSAQRPVQTAEWAPATFSLALSVVDERGQPVAGARVIGGPDAGPHICDAFGRLVLTLPPGVTELTIEAEGYEPVHQSVRPGGSSQRTVMLSARLPASEIKGAVRNLSGQPLHARVEVPSLGLVAHSDAQGQFVIGVAPGDYTLRISADGYESQERSAQVEPRGVTILVVDLHEAQP